MLAHLKIVPSKVVIGAPEKRSFIAKLWKFTLNMILAPKDDFFVKSTSPPKLDRDFFLNIPFIEWEQFLGTLAECFGVMKSQKL